MRGPGKSERGSPSSELEPTAAAMAAVSKTLEGYIVRFKSYALAATVLSLTAFAARADPTAAATPAGQDNSVSPVVVTATRADVGVSIDLTGTSITVLQAQDLRDRQTQLVSDILRDVPGVEVNRMGAVGGLTQVRMRGAEGDHTLVLIDGVKADDPYDGEFDLGGLIADDVAKVEVLRGEQSALYGSDAIGGVINYITLNGADAPGLRARLESGSFGTVEASARAAGVSGPFDYALSGAYYDTGGYVVAPGGARDIGARIGTISGRASYQVSDAFQLRAVGRFNRTNAGVNDQDYIVTGDAIDSGGHYVNTAYDGLVGARYSAFDGRWIQDLSAQAAWSQRDGFDDSNARTSGDQGLRRKASYVSTFKLSSGAVAQTLTGAVDYEREDWRNTDPTGFADTTWRHTVNWGFVGEYNAVLNDRAEIGGAVRHDANSRFADDATYHVQASYLFDSGARLHAATGTGVKAPGPSELYGYSPVIDFAGNPNLKPEQSTGWEVGLGQELLGRRVRLDATYFSSVLHNEITVNYAVSPNTPINLTTESTRKGVELSAQAILSPSWRLAATYTYLDSRQDGVEEIRRPRSIASGNVAWRSADDRLGANLTVRYNGEQTDTNFATFSTVTLKAFALVNFGADYRITKALRIYGRVENLFDQTYQEVFGFNTPGRAAYVGLRVGF